MKKNKKILVYDPYLDILGGGEKHILSIIKVFAESGYKPTILWDDPSIVHKIEKDLGINIPNLRVEKNFLFSENSIQKLMHTRNYDYLFYVTDGSYFFSLAKHNYIFAMVPQRTLYNMSALNKLKLTNYSFIANSAFTQSKLKTYGIDSIVIHPYIEDSHLKTYADKKDKIILTVGRFFSHLHSKNQELLIDTFIKLKQKEIFSDYRLCLAGRLKDEDKDFFQKLEKKVATTNDVILMPNISQKDLLDLYKSAKYYWHFTGYGIDENIAPEKVEHLGIAPLEAMAAGCASFVYKAGGVVDLIEDGNTGFLFVSDNDLIQKMEMLEKKDDVINAVRKKAHRYVADNFSYSVFNNNVKVALSL